MPVYTVFTENYLTPIQKKRISKNYGSTQYSYQRPFRINHRLV